LSQGCPLDHANLLEVTAEQEIESSVETLTAILRHEHRRAATGATMRTHLHKQIELGNDPEHYRMDWLRESVLEIMEHLQIIADNFNRTHDNDKASIGDMLDILHSTAKNIRTKTGYSGD
jgi:hypothetical protein